MDKVRILMIMTLICVIYASTASAQSRISSVYGVNLGDSESVVASKINGSWKTTSKGEKYYYSSNPTLGNCTFQQVTFWFKSGKLYCVSFSSADGGSMDPDFRGAYGGPNGYEQFLANAERYQKMYRTMYFDLSSKYGSPVIDNGESAVWKSNGNMIEIKYNFEDETNQFGWHDGFTSISVRYVVSDSSSSNF